MSRGQLRVYLGAAPGVGKTFAMLSEGRRRRERGTDVVIASLTPYARPATDALAEGMERLDRSGSIDVSAVLLRRPSLALVDDLAGASSQPGQHSRWSGVQELLDIGIDVITTINISELESLSDAALRITGTSTTRTVPDGFVRGADQVELVDMTPEALRRRLAHGNIFPAEHVDAALANFFRVGNLSALRELALSWLADRVEESLDTYLDRHGVAGTWETRERIVVGITGVPGGEAVIRRAARLADRSRGSLVGVHVVPENGFASRSGVALQTQRQLLNELGGTFQEVVGDAVGVALAGFAVAERATQVVVGVSTRTWLDHIRRQSVVKDVLRLASGFDVHVISAVGVNRPPLPRRIRRRRALSGRRIATAWALLGVGLPVLTFVLSRFPRHVGLSTALLLFLAMVMTTSLIGGLLPGITAAVTSVLLSNWFFVTPRHSLSIASSENVVALIVFVLVGTTVSTLVDRMARSSADALRARAETDVLARSTASLAADPDVLEHLVRQLLVNLPIGGAAVLSRDDDDGWSVEAFAGDRLPVRPNDGTSFALDDDGRHQLVLVDARLSADDHHLLRALTNQFWLAIETRKLHRSAAEAGVLSDTNALRAAMLQAVSHDLRTPLASIKASATSLLSGDIEWSRHERGELLSTIDEEADRLDRLVGNLLDMSRLQAGGLSVRHELVAVDEVVERALLGVPDPHDLIAVDIDEDAIAIGDAALLERALANVVANALVWSPDESAVRVEASLVGGDVHIRVVDRGPGIVRSMRDVVFEPFQRLGDRSNAAGVGLGLAIARGFVRAMGGEVELDDTPGGGLTVTMRLPGRKAEVNAGDETTDEKIEP